MESIKTLISEPLGVPALTDDRREQLSALLDKTFGLEVYRPSVSLSKGMLLAMGRRQNEKLLVAVADPSAASPIYELSPMPQTVKINDEDYSYASAPISHEAADLVRRLVPWTAPQVVGLKCSAGLGDRLGLATPGHARAVAGTGVVPYFAQQSIREMTRTERNPAEVMDAATWGVLQAGWRDGFGSDADHLKTPEDIESCDPVGFTMFTIDPGDHVNDEADEMAVSDLQAAWGELPWEALEISPEDFKKAYAGQTFNLDGGGSLTLDEQAVLRGAVKYGRAIAHTLAMFRHLQSRRGRRGFELEVSVDETASPTTVEEHYLIAAELKRLGVQWVGLAPRFIGEFEKGIDYKGDLKQFETEFARHVAVAKTLGPYKFSIHSGSDKFSIYPIIARLAGPNVHLKTAGTSYLEALRVIARKAPALFRRILEFAWIQFDQDRATYHISANKNAVPAADDLADDQLESVLDNNDGRQLLHVTFGSVLTARTGGAYTYREELRSVLLAHEQEHEAVLAEHLGRHIQPFAQS